MPYFADDRVLETSATTGTGSLTTVAAVTGFIRFSAAKQRDGTAIATSDTFPYAIWGVDATTKVPTGEWEVGDGTYSAANTIARTTVLRSSNAGALVNFTGGSLYVSMGLSALRNVALNNELAVELPRVTVASVAVAVTDSIKVFARRNGGGVTLRRKGAAGAEKGLQDHLTEGRTLVYLPNSGTTVGLNLGGLWTSAGTVSHPTPTSTAPAVYSQTKRTRWANVVTTTNQILGLRTATADKTFWRGNAAGLGGFRMHGKFSIGLWPAATVRLFVGMTDSTAGYVISDTLTGNGCGFWHDTTEAASVLNFVTRNGTTATKAAITLAANLAVGQFFEFWINSEPNGSVIGYKLVELNTGTTLVDTTTSTTIPLNTVFMGPECAMSNGTANITVTTTAFETQGFMVQADN